MLPVKHFDLFINFNTFLKTGLFDILYPMKTIQIMSPNRQDTKKRQCRLEKRNFFFGVLGDLGFLAVQIVLITFFFSFAGLLDAQDSKDNALLTCLRLISALQHWKLEDLDNCRPLYDSRSSTISLSLTTGRKWNQVSPSNCG